VREHAHNQLKRHEGQDQRKRTAQRAPIGVQVEAVCMPVGSVIVCHALTIRARQDRHVRTDGLCTFYSPGAMARADNSDQALLQRTTLVSIAVAGLLVATKLGVGLATGSLGLISAGVESSGDVIAATLTFFAVRLGGRPADLGHPYGHRRAQNLGALGEAAILLGGGLLVSVEAIRHLLAGGNAPQTHWYEFAVMALALVLDASRTAISFVAAQRYSSPAMRANAFHFAGDMAGSVAVLVGLAAVGAGFDQGDALAALAVAAIIFVAAYRLVAENANVLMDRTPAQARAAAERAISALGEDVELSRLRLRESAGRYFADVVVSVPPGQAVVEGHRTADLIEVAVESALPGSDVVVHVEPRQGTRDRALGAAGEGGARHSDLPARRLRDGVAAPEVPRRPRPRGSARGGGAGGA
jgi:cation diffusion facilitator family transporter